MTKLTILAVATTWSWAQLAALCGVLCLLAVVLNATGSDTDGDSGDGGD